MMEVILHSRDRSIECLNWTNQDCRLWIRFQSAITQGKISWFSITWPSSIDDRVAIFESVLKPPMILSLHIHIYSM
jgi:hypothetical protein